MINNYQSVAGAFMPASTGEQDETVNELLKKTDLLPDNDKIKAIVVPHAGYIYSGQVAASGYKQISGGNFEKVILVGPSHREYFEGIFEGVSDHSVEVQIPFIRNVLPAVDISVYVYGDISYHELAGKMMEKYSGECMIIVSSDLSHFYPYSVARLMDEQANKAIVNLDFERTESSVEACGKTGIMALMEIAKDKKWTGKLLMYRNSGDTAGDRKSVVGYGCYGFYKS